MKKFLSVYNSFIAIVAMCLLFSCANEDAVYSEEEGDYKGWHKVNVKLNVSREQFDVNSSMKRGVEDGWQDGDRIYLILKDKDGNNVQAYVAYDAVNDAWGQVEYDGYKSYLTCTEPRLVEAYFFDGTTNVTTTDITFDATTGVYACLDGAYTYPSDGDLYVNIELVPLTSRIRFTGEAEKYMILEGVSTYGSFSRTEGLLEISENSVYTMIQSNGSSPYIYCLFSTPSEPTLTITNDGNTFQTVLESATDVLQQGVSGFMAMPTLDRHRGWKTVSTTAVTSVSLDKSKIIFDVIGTEVTLNATVLPIEATNSEISWSSSDPSVASVSSSGVVTALQIGTATIIVTSKSNSMIKAECVVNVVNANGHDYVDLDLTSGTLWATMNIGADSPEDYGDYFAWGEVSGYNSGKTSFSWQTYELCNGTGTSITDFCTDSYYGTVDDAPFLDNDHDVADKQWGGSWFMPYSEQFEELYNECTWTWTTMNGVSGYKVVSKKNSNFIFFPAAGRRSNTALNYSETSGYYWSSSLNMNYNNQAYDLYFSSSNVYSANDDYRYYGLSVRPVIPFF